MYKQSIIDIIKDIDLDLNVGEAIDQDFRTLGMDSIGFIQFMALIEETFDVEFEYDFMDKHELISVEVLNGVIAEKHMK